MNISLHDSVRINDPVQGSYLVKCSPYSDGGERLTSRSRRVMGQVNVVEAKVGPLKTDIPVLVLALITLEIENNTYAPFFIIASMVERPQSSAYLPYRAFELDTHTLGGWEYKLIQANLITRPLCAVPVLKNKISYDLNPHNEKDTWYYVFGERRFSYGISRKEEYYTTMLPNTTVFPTYDELLQNQHDMNLDPNFSTGEDDIFRNNDEIDDADEEDYVEDDDNDNNEEDDNDYDEDERVKRYNTRDSNMEDRNEDEDDQDEEEEGSDDGRDNED